MAQNANQTTQATAETLIGQLSELLNLAVPAAKSSSELLNMAVPVAKSYVESQAAEAAKPEEEKSWFQRNKTAIVGAVSGAAGTGLGATTVYLLSDSVADETVNAFAGAGSSCGVTY